MGECPAIECIITHFNYCDSGRLRLISGGRNGTAERASKRARANSVSSVPSRGSDMNDSVVTGTSDETDSACPSVVTVHSGAYGLIDCLQHYTSVEPLSEKIVSIHVHVFQ